MRGGVEHTHLTINDITRTYINIDRSTNIDQDYKIIYGRYKVTDTYHSNVGCRLIY